MIVTTNTITCCFISCVYLVLMFLHHSTGAVTAMETALPEDHSSLQVDCHALQMGQFYCDDPIIDNSTQQALGCQQETQTVKVPCYTVPGITCKGGELLDSQSSQFFKEVACKWTNGVSFKISLLLSIFLGMFGIDRFYLGYPAIGLMKFCTFGFMFLGQLLDILLIALQVVGPADGSAYVMDYYGAGLTRLSRDNNTYVRPQNFT